MRYRRGDERERRTKARVELDEREGVDAFPLEARTTRRAAGRESVRRSGEERILDMCGV